jgi:type IV secretion system protein VirD4
MLYLFHEAPVEEQSFTMVMEMLGSAEVREDDESYLSPLDLLFERLQMQSPEHIAVKQYGIYKQAAGKTAKSILISVGVRLAAFNLSQISSITQYDEMDLESLGQSKVALFCVISDNDSSFNYLIGMLYTQAFQSLYYLADHQYGGRLPMHVHALMDEFANVALPEDFEKILSTMRSREISVSIIIQNLAQLKALFKDSWESIVGNCDEFLYLGGNEQSTHEYVSKLLGKETIDTNTYGKSQGKSGSYSTNYQQSGRELLMPDEVRLLDNEQALLFLRGERAIIDRKIDLLKHPTIKMTTDGGHQPYRHDQAALLAGDIHFDASRPEDYELLTESDWLDQPEEEEALTIRYEFREETDHE